jgi:hypothetical protein
VQRALFCFLILWAARPALAQVQIDARLEKARYLAGEPIVVRLDVRNVGDEALTYSECARDVRLEVVGANRRMPPNIYGCFEGRVSGAGCGIGSHAPLLSPGETTSVTYLLKEYDLSPGQYRLNVSGRSGVHWRSVSSSPTVAARASHAPTEPVPGAQFEHTLSLNIVAGDENELIRALAPVVSDADAADPSRRHNARAAIIESAPRFLDSLIVRFAEEDRFDTGAIDALGRLATAASRAHLRERSSGRDPRRFDVLLALARARHPDDAALLSSLLADGDVDLRSRSASALGLGYIGAEQAVRDLERALPSAPYELRSTIATALGNTRSGLAVPILIGMFGNNPAHDKVLAALKTLTHRPWSSDAGGDPAAQRRRWMRWWSENGSSVPLFGPDECPAEPVTAANEFAPPVRATVRRSDKPPRPRVSSVWPTVAARNSMVTILGYRLGYEETPQTRVVLIRGDVKHVVETHAAAGGSLVDDRAPQYMDIELPSDLTPGRWTLAVETSAGRSRPVMLDITENTEPVFTGISPARPHPAQMVSLATARTAQIDSSVELTDASNRQWQISPGVSPRDVNFILPDEVADGEAAIRVRWIEGGVERFSAPFKFIVTSAPLPLERQAVTLMKPVAPGQWTDLGTNYEIDWEVERADRVEIEFRQGDVASVKQATGLGVRHVEVPAEVVPGQVRVRTRTWIEQDVSPWSPSMPFRVLKNPVPPSVDWIGAGPGRTLVWWSGDDAPAFAQVQRGEALVLFGHFPVARAAELRVRLIGKSETYELAPTYVLAGVQVEVPGLATPGDWRLMIETKDRPSRPVVVKMRVISTPVATGVI